GELTALIDFGDSRCGPVVREFTTFAIRDVSALGPVAAGYGIDLEKMGRSWRRARSFDSWVGPAGTTRSAQTAGDSGSTSSASSHTRRPSSTSCGVAAPRYSRPDSFEQS